jgi:hypothetical protein
MKVRVTSAYAGFSVGDVIPDMPGGQARTLISRGLIEEVIETKRVQAPINRMVQPPVERSNQNKPTLKLK